MANCLEDRNAIVTGAARGMGFAIAQALYAEGARVALLDIDGPGALESARSLDAEGSRAVGRQVDVRRKDEIEALVEWVVQAWGGVDILINNAGGALNTPHRLEEIRESDWDLVVDVNLKGAFFCSQAVIPYMVRQGRGTVVNMSALAGHWRASLAGVQYTAAKAGIEGLTRQLAYDWGSSGIRVNAVAPTVTFTGQRIQSLWDQKTEAEQRKVLAAIPLARIGSMTEVAAAIVFLASDASSYITGITLDVSGGRYLR